MSYEPTIWENGKTPINADNLNKIENELSLLSTNTEALQSEIDEAKADIEELKNKVDVDITEGSTKTLPNSFNGGLRFTEMLGASEQDGTPTPDNPQEIKSVSISEMKTHGKNLYNGTYANKYDLFIPANTPFTVSTNSGEPPSHFYIYDSAGNQIDYWVRNLDDLNAVIVDYLCAVYVKTLDDISKSLFCSASLNLIELTYESNSLLATEATIYVCGIL